MLPNINIIIFLFFKWNIVLIIFFNAIMNYFFDNSWNTFNYVSKSFFILIIVLVSVAFFTLLERKFLSAVHKRKGPTKVGLLGIFQPIADGLKLILKETIIPRNSFLIIFFLSPILSFIFGFILWSLIPFQHFSILYDLNYGILFIFIISVFHVYSIILAGWASNSKYSFLGALRSSAQLVAYDIALGLILLNLFLVTKSLNLNLIIEFQKFNGWLIFYYPLLFIMFFVCPLAETNRHPFDLPEAEAELVSGYNVEYSASGFALFFLGEYSSMLFMSFLIVNLFFGGWYFLNYSFFLNLIIYIIKLTFIIYMFIMARAAIPRYRYDQLMKIGWKFLLPINLLYLFVNIIILFVLNGFYKNTFIF